jgi:flavin-dependent dehydrogenase
MCAHHAPRYFQRTVDRLRARWGFGSDATPPPMQKILPLSTVTRTYGRRLLAVGDAAGLVKSTTGGGIYYSLLSATLAAEVLADALAQDDPG